MNRLLTSLLLGLLGGRARADGSFRSRPDLSPPHLNITLPCRPGACETGYLFVAPYTQYAAPRDEAPYQVAPYILTDGGELVWSGYGYITGWTANFQAARYRGQDVLFAFEGGHNQRHGHGHGHHTLLDAHYETVRVVRGGGHLLADKHEFAILDETTAVFDSYHPLQRPDLARYGGAPDQTWIVDGRFQEVDIATGRVLFEWHSLDHVSPQESVQPLGTAGDGRRSTTAWDYLHINSVTKGRDGHYLVSARHASTVYKINGSDGSVVWRLGGARSDFALGAGVRFALQHHARYFAEGPAPGDADVVTLFDNGPPGTGARGKYIALDHAARTASLVRVLDPPGGRPLAVASQGSLQPLRGTGGDLVNWGAANQVTEYDAAGRPVFHAHLGDGGALRLQNYRAFKFNWTGFAAETPALVAEEAAAGPLHVRAFVSWNGDTRAAAWRFLWTEEAATTATTKPTAARPRSKVVARAGFETVAHIHPSGDVRVASVWAEALDADGRVLTVSAPVGVQPAVPGGGGRSKHKAPGPAAQGDFELQRSIQSAPSTHSARRPPQC